MKMSEWKELKTLQEVAAAQADGEEIECDFDGIGWRFWLGEDWKDSWRFRSRPRKKVKQVVLREALFRSSEKYWTSWVESEKTFCNFVRWLDTPERIVEVEE
jgi:hypothetical protein